MLIPYQVDTLFQRTPWANVGIIVVNVAVFILMLCGVIPDAVVQQMVLSQWSLSQLITYQFLHAGFLHLLFNMLYLWVFGNAVCAIVDVWIYPGLYLVLGIFAGVVHMLASGLPVVGASGAISGIMGFYLAVYPTNKISCFWMFFVRTGTFELSGYILILLWFGVNLFSAFAGGGHVAYWSHAGGFVGGFFLGIVFLKLNLVDRTDVDLPDVLGLLRETRSKNRGEAE
jgi:membrane associated rhomboid family serine protease